MMLAFSLESKTILSENAVGQKSSKVSRNSIYVYGQRATEEGGRRFENNPFLCMVPYENEDIINAVNYLQVYFLVYTSLFSSRQMCFDGLYLKVFRPSHSRILCEEFELSKTRRIYQDWRSLLWCMCGYLNINQFITVGFLLP